ncbi:hypothetical protein BIW11_01254 [Tropilaelaps mercedesae]|uniref:Ensconsin-like n=1 Tax=Tropilaelaps mercedesae TaxID=418985 RepID=A0A1V9XGN8_9ACAR|nr:hypothetical protein BIW11_01254 [Tropilaelaps mercedesae]
MAYNRRRQPPPRGSYWFAQSGSDVADCLRRPPSAEIGHHPVNQPLTAAIAAHTPQGQQQLQQHDVSAAAVTGLIHQNQAHQYTQANPGPQINQQQPHTQSPTSALTDWNGGLQINTDPQHAERVRVESRERQELLHRRRMEELAAHNENAQRIREEGEGDRRRNNQERVALTEIHKQQVDERRRALHEADQEWREAVLRRSQERDLKAEQYRRNRLSASILLEGTQVQPASVMSSPARGASGDLMTRSMIVTSSAARRKTDLTPVTPSPWARGLGAGSKALTPSRPQTAAGSAGTPKRAVSMSRLDILAQPRRRFTMEDLKSRSHSAWKLNDSPQSGQAGLKGMKGARSMSHLSSTPHPPRLTRTTQMRAQQSQMQSNSKGHQSTSSSRSEQVSPTHQLSAPHHLRSRSQMSSDLSQSSVASSVGSPHANMRPKAQGSANRKVRPLSIAGSIPSSELDRKDKGQPLMKPHKPVPPASSPEPQAAVRQRRSASPKKKELSPQKEQVSSTRDVLDDALTSEEMAVPVCSAVPVDIPLLMTQSFTEGCMPIENRPAEARKTKTREEAMAEIAEARRKAREEFEKQADEERRKKEEEAAARRAIQEKRRQLEEEARLKREKEEEEKRRQEEEERRAEEERIRQEEEEKRVLEEKAKQEAIERQKKEELERLERKKRVEEIMARTRKARAAVGNKEAGDSNGQQGEAGVGDSNESSANVSPVRELNGSALASAAGAESNNSLTGVAKEPATANQTQNGLLNGHGANNGAGQAKVTQDQVMILPAGGNNPNVIEKKEPVSIDNSANGPASTDSGTGSADFNSNSTQPAAQPEHPASGNNNLQPVQPHMLPVLPGQATTTDAPLVAQGPLIQG